MARIFITGSSDGLGLLAAKKLISEGHRVICHARNEARSKELVEKLPVAETVLHGDLSKIQETKKLAKKANELGTFDAVIHNAGVYQASGEQLLSVNTLAPYILTCLMQKPKRLIYLSSGMHTGGNWSPRDVERGHVSYSDTKLHDVILCKAVAQARPSVYANAVDPGWVPTKMGGKNAPDSLEKGFETQAWLAVSDELSAKVTSRYFYHKQEHAASKLADDPAIQNSFIELCEKLTGVKWEQ